MKCQSLFSEKNKKLSSICLLLNLPYNISGAFCLMVHSAVVSDYVSGQRNSNQSLWILIWAFIDSICPRTHFCTMWLAYIVFVSFGIIELILFTSQIKYRLSGGYGAFGVSQTTVLHMK